VTVTAGSGYATTTAADGSYAIADLPAGAYTLALHLPSYLQGKSAVTVTAGAAAAVPDVTLRAGDANGDCVVNLTDLVLVSTNFRKSPPSNAEADINGDGQVDLFDLILVSLNLARQCP
jgi:hypothetical protein